MRAKQQNLCRTLILSDHLVLSTLSQHVPALSGRGQVHVHHCITSLLSKVIDAQGENCVGLQTLGEHRAEEISSSDPK